MESAQTGEFGQNVRMAIPCMHYICEVCLSRDPVCFCGDSVSETIEIEKIDDKMTPATEKMMMECYKEAYVISADIDYLNTQLTKLYELIKRIQLRKPELMRDIEYISPPNADELRNEIQRDIKSCEDYINKLETELMRDQVALRCINKSVYLRKFLIEPYTKIWKTVIKNEDYEIHKYELMGKKHIVGVLNHAGILIRWDECLPVSSYISIFHNIRVFIKISIDILTHAWVPIKEISFESLNILDKVSYMKVRILRDEIVLIINRLIKFAIYVFDTIKYEYQWTKEFDISQEKIYNRLLYHWAPVAELIKE